MLDRIDMTGMTRGLLAAVLLCLSVVLSQMAHAGVPVIPVHDAQATQAVTSDAASPATHEAAAHSHGDRKADPSKAGDHTGPSDMKCASHCPSVFVSTGSHAVHAVLPRATTSLSFHAAFTGRHVDTADRPPRT